MSGRSAGQLQTGNPDSRTDAGELWIAAMRRGDFDAAWGISDAVLRRRRSRGEDCSAWPRHLQFVWTGRPLTGRRILVRCYHGLGDTIQFLRFLRPLRALARHVALWVQPALLDLAATADGVDQLLPLHDGEPELDYDTDIEIMELPHALRVTPATLPREVPYLFPSASAWQEPSHALAVGVIWQAGSWDTRRSLPESLVKRLAEVPGIRLLSLQHGAAAAHAWSLGMTDIACDRIGETAGRMLKFDLIVSVDTMAAHLAGAIGCPVWTLLHHDCDWRWARDRVDSVWYPTMRLFRQHQSNNWQQLGDEVCAALARQAAKQPRR